MLTLSWPSDQQSYWVHQIFLNLRSHDFKVEHVDEAVEGFDESLARSLREFKFIHDYDKLYFLDLFKQSLQKIWDSNHTNVISGVLVSCHVDQAQPFFKVNVDVRS